MEDGEKSTLLHKATVFSKSADVIKALFEGLEPGDKLKLLVTPDFPREPVAHSSCQRQHCFLQLYRRN